MYLYGTANCSYTVALDGIVYRNNVVQNNVLWAMDSIPLGTHRIQLSLEGPIDPSSGSQLAFDRAVVRDETNAEYVHSIIAYGNGG